MKLGKTAFILCSMPVKYTTGLLTHRINIPFKNKGFLLETPAVFN